MTIDYLLMNYSGSELLDMARKGLLYVDSYDVSKIVCAATEQFLDMESAYQIPLTICGKRLIIFQRLLVKFRVFLPDDYA